jgi:uncharacterized protein YkwD
LQLNWIDLLLVVIVLLSLWSGYKSGFIAGFLDLFVWLGSLCAALFCYQYVGVWLEKIFPKLGVWTLPLAFLIALILIRILLSFIARRISYTIPKETHRSEVNKVAGIVPGAINGIVWATIISALLLAFPISDKLSAETRESGIANKLSAYVEWLDEKFSPVFDDAVDRTINKLTVNPDSATSINLSFTVSNPKTRPDLESKMLEMLNEERTSRGLKPLQPDNELTIVARKHSKDMFARGYFSHITPEGKTPSKRIREDGIRFLTAGENLALGQTLSICHNGLMNSPGHKANILNPEYGHVGIGILDGGMYGLMITQNFKN